ncbi:MAG TPA: tail fiber domain-containing protein [Vicinamibacterales bacterium]
MPRLITVTGTYQPASGQPAPASAVVTLAVYTDPTGGTALFQETQDVTLDASGRYAVQLGATQPDGLPLALFAEGQERWLGVQFAGVNEVEHARARLTSVPYALRAADAETLGGHPASAYLLSPKAASGDAATSGADSTATAKDVQVGTINTLAKYVTTVDVGDSAVVETGGRVGIGTTTPLDFLHVRYTNTNGGLTGFAVQNLGSTATSYSGMLFFDHNGVLSQFQGFNNITHEYRINNIAKTGGVTDGSINFMIGATSRFLVTSTGSIGVGTPAPAALLDVSNGLVGTSAIANIYGTTYGANSFGTEIVGRKARGTLLAPTAAQNGDALAIIGGKGFGATGFSGSTSGMFVQTAENWTDAAQGSLVYFTTTPTGTTQPLVRMTLTPTGNAGIGTFTPVASLEVSNAISGAAFANIVTSSFTGSTGTGSAFVGRKARGTSVAPTAAQNGDVLTTFIGRGFATTSFGSAFSGMSVLAAENFTTSAQGSFLNFYTTAVGTAVSNPSMTIDPSGNVGIGTSPAFPGAPLEVSRTGSDAGILTSVYTNGSNVNPFYIAAFANGTATTPTATQTGNVLGVWAATGYGTTQFGDVAGGMGVIAEENFTDTAQGSATGLFATPIGTTVPHLNLAILPSGNVGIGDWAIPGGNPTATDKLQVFGDIRVGTSGTNGCVMNFAGSGLVGVCASDRRYKKGVTPFARTLDRLTALQPVHFYWRADEFPEHHFGDSQAYGLIAQEVEQVLPELVVTHDDGYKAVDYSALPLLTIQAVKELKAENDDLKRKVGEIDELKKRVADLERLLKDLQQRASIQR